MQSTAVGNWPLRFAKIFLGCLAVSSLPYQASAQSVFNWTANTAGTNVWTNSANWSNGLIANEVGAVVNFSNTAVITNVWSNSAITVGAMNFSGSAAMVVGDPAALNDTLVLSSGSTSSPSISVTGSGQAYMYVDSLSGTNGYSKTGAGELTFRFNTTMTNSSSLIGDIRLLAGTLTLQHDANLGNPTNNLYVTAGAILMGNSSATGNTNTIGASRTVNLMTNTNSTLVNIYSGNSPSVFMIQGNVTDNGIPVSITKANTGTLNFAGGLVTSGDFTINAGTVILSGTNAYLATNRAVTNITGTINFGGKRQTIGSLALNGSASAVRSFIFTNGSLTVNGGANMQPQGTNGTFTDFSGLDEFVFNGTNRTVAFNASGSFTVGLTNEVAVYLARANGGSNTFKAGILQFGGGGGTAPTSEAKVNAFLGKVNHFYATNFILGGYQGMGSMVFGTNISNGILTMRGPDGISRMTTARFGLVQSGTRFGSGYADLTTNGASLDALATEFIVGSHGVNSSSPADNSYLIFSNGTIDADNFVVGDKSAGATTGAATTPDIRPSFQQNGGTVRAQNLILGRDSVSDTFTTNGTNYFPYNQSRFFPVYNLSGGTLYAGNVLVPTTVNSSNTPEYGATSRRVLRFNGGTLRNYDPSTDLLISGDANPLALNAGGRIYLTAGSNNGTMYVAVGRTSTVASSVTWGSEGTTNTPSAGAIIKSGPGTLDLQCAFGTGLDLQIADGIVKMSNVPSITISVTGSNGVLQIPYDASTGQGLTNGVGILKLGSLGGYTLTANNIQAAIGCITNEFGIPDATSDFVLTLANSSAIDLRGLTNGLAYSSATRIFKVESLGQTNSVFLPSNTLITADQIQIGLTATNVSVAKLSRVYLEGLNFWNSALNTIGGFRGAGEVYLTNGASLSVLGKDGVSPLPQFFIGRKSSGAEGNNGLLNATNGSLNLVVNEVYLGVLQLASGANNGSVDGVLSMKEGNFEARKLVLSERNFSSAAPTNSTLTGTNLVRGIFNQYGGSSKVSNLVVARIYDSTNGIGTNFTAANYPGHTNLVYQPAYHLFGGTLSVAEVTSDTVVYSNTSSRMINLAGGTLQNYDTNTSTTLAGNDITDSGCLKLNLTSGTTNTINVDGDQAITLASTVKITGEGDLTKTGSGDLVMQGASTYPLGSNNIILGGGGLKLGFTGTNNTQTYLTVVADSTLDVGSWAEMHFRGADVSGSGKLIVKGSAKIYFGSNSTTLSSASLANIQSFSYPALPARLSSDGQLLFGAPENPPVITSTNSFSGTVGMAFNAQVTATGDNPIAFSATNLPAGLSITSAGEISGTPSSGGTYSTTLTASNNAGSSDQFVTFLIASPAGSTFAGWSGGLALSPDLLGRYAIGGAASSGGASAKPELATDSNTLSLTAIVRTNDPSLAVVGEAGGDLTSWSTSGVTMTVSPNTNNVPAGHQRRVYSVDRTNNPSKQFLRLKAKLQP